MTTSKKEQLDKIVYTMTRTIPANSARLAKYRIIAEQRQNPNASAFHILRTRVLRRLRQENWNTLAITGPTPGVGKSLVASNLAVSMALDVNQTVLLVDLDLRRPSIPQYFGVNPKEGIQDYLEGDVELEDLLINPGIERLVLLSGKGSTLGSSELLASPKMVELAKELRERYRSRYVIFDLPPICTTDDAIAFLPFVDCTMLVVASGENTETEVNSALSLLEGTELLGTVFNKATQKISSYSY